MENLTNLVNFVDQYHGPKIVVIITGGGMGLLDILKIPGASKIIETIYVPYSREEVKKFGENYLAKKEEYIEWENILDCPGVSRGVVEALVRASNNCWNQDNDKVIVGCTAALTTNRYRKGNNHAWIGWSHPKMPWPGIKSKHISLPKIQKAEFDKLSLEQIVEQRNKEDTQTVDAILNLLLDLNY